MRTRLPRWCRVAVVGGLSFLAVPIPARAQTRNANPIEHPEVRKLEFSGASAVDPYELEKRIATGASQCKGIAYALFCPFSHWSWFYDEAYLDRRELARDIVRLRVYYFQLGYRSAIVDTIVTKTGDDQVKVTFAIDEGPPTLIHRIQIDYDSTLLRRKRVEKATLLHAGDPLDLIRLDSMRVLFANEMWAEGHSDATVDTSVVVDAAGRSADLHLRLIPNHATFVGEINVLGLQQVDRQTVLNSITLRPGEAFRQQNVLESQRNLFESNLFRLAAVEVPPQFDSVKQIRITVLESPLHDAHTGVGMTNIEFIKADAQYSAFNLFGGARRLDISAAIGNLLGQQLAGNGFFYEPDSALVGDEASLYLAPTWAASIDFRQPAFLRRPRNQAGISAFAHRRSTPGIFIDRGWGGAVTLTNQVRVRAPLSLTYRFESNRVDAGDVYFCVNYGVCEAPTITTLRGRHRLSPLSLTGYIDRSDDPLDPTRGYLARVDLEHASSLTQSDYGYNRGYLDVAAYNHHGAASVYSAHLRLGVVRASGDDALHPRKLLYSGGASSVRGYATNQLGPRVLTISADFLTDTNRAIRCDAASIEKLT